MAMTEQQTTTDGRREGAGRIISVIGPVIDVEFPPDALPEVTYALEFEKTLAGETTTVTAEVSQHIGHSTVRAVCMQPADGIARGTRVRDTGHPISVPVGSAIQGHVFNVLGQPLDVDADSLDVQE